MRDADAPRRPPPASEMSYQTKARTMSLGPTGDRSRAHKTTRDVVRTAPFIADRSCPLERPETAAQLISKDIGHLELSEVATTVELVPVK
jgi:hypothetical protein